jgi:uncharacterized protein (TIGR03000 family)
LTKRTILAAALALVAGGAGAVQAGFFHGPWDLSAGPYFAAPPYSYNVAYGYNLPYGSYQLYNPFDPFQYPGRGAYYPRESFYSLPPYGQELYTGPRFRDRFHAYPAPLPGEAVLPSLSPVPGTVVERGTAVIDVNVPAGAEVWFDGEKTTQTGGTRAFRSPPLQPGTTYLYLVRAKWKDDGRDVDQMQTLPVHSGERVRITFPLARP